MSALLVVGAFLAVTIGVAHSYLGERYILIRLFRRNNLPRLFGDDTFTRGTLRFAWHITTIAWWGFAAQLALAARPATASLDAVLQVIAWTFAISAAVAFVAGRGRHLAWVVFGAIAGCVWLAG